MRHSLFVIALILLATTTIHAQDKIEGIGKFKIGLSTPAIVDEVAKEMRVKVVMVNGTLRDKYYYSSKPKINQVFPHPSSPIDSPLSATHCPDAKVYDIIGYSVAGIELRALTLTFYRDTLASIYCSGTAQIEEALRTKYGAPERKEVINTIQCVHTAFGAKTDYNLRDTRDYWRNGRIVAVLADIEGLTPGCQRNNNNYLLVGYPDVNAIIDQCDAQARKDKLIPDRKALSAF